MKRKKPAINDCLTISTIYKLRNGDVVAYKQLFDRYYRHLVILGMRYVGDQDLAENIVQEVFVNLWEKKDVLEIQSVQAYLVVSVRNRCRNEIKRQKVIRTYQSNFFQDAFQPEADFPDDFVMKKIMSVIDSMPEKRRKIFKLNRIEGMKYKEIALVMHISPKTVEIQIGKALKYLRENLAGLKNKVFHEN
ncbi:MAG: RNA polymerase sigma-70 factor [Marinilabiliaceae bacterium]|nr:RNA polymerase sigma-70 factor [Marinilabiliaceae bacterium]